MCNPLYSWDTDKVFHTGHRWSFPHETFVKIATPTLIANARLYPSGFHRLCRALDPDFDLSRLIMKVPSTWEGLQACRRLKADGIKTLATTLFTMEQAILAGEAGCTSISPFAHELRAHLGTPYHDIEPILSLYLAAQQYYRHHAIPTKIKSCGFMTADEIMSMAGVDAMTLPAEQLEELRASPAEPRESLEKRSVFHDAAPILDKDAVRRSYVDDKVEFDRAYCTNGRGRAKTEDSIAVFCGFQIQAEELVRMSELN
ncbi:MAG: hypothetical protein Q9207_006147 [Kuettlingeria erythrocarpa]